jgi:hypothetical protein
LGLAVVAVQIRRGDEILGKPVAGGLEIRHDGSARASALQQACARDAGGITPSVTEMRIECRRAEPRQMPPPEKPYV